ncbi:MAG: SnoaL-like domain-containing protein, partial [Parafilimonas sp.]
LINLKVFTEIQFQIKHISYSNLILKKMTTKEIAERLVTMCRNGKIEEAKEKLFAQDIISIEPFEGILPKEVKGMDAIKKKAELFISLVENFYDNKISDPIIAGDYFSISWETDLQMKGEARKTNNELCLYKTKEGKIISEQFFY